MLIPQHIQFDTPIGVGFSERVTLVVLLFSLADSKEYFRIMLSEIDPQRNKGKALCRRPRQTATNFRTMKQQLARPFRLVVQTIRFQVFLNIATNEPNFIVFRFRVRFGQRTASFAQALYFTSDKYDATLDGIEDFVIVPGLSILTDNFNVWIGVLLFLFRVFGF